MDPVELKSLLEQSRNYEFGDSRLKLTEIHDQIASVYESPTELKKAETVLLDSLRSDCSFALKDFICRELSIIGTESSVPVLMGMLRDEKTSAPAGYALVRIPSDAVDKALLKALPASEKGIQIGILSTLGLRKTAAAVPVIYPLLNSQDVEVAGAALSAMGQIGTAEAARILQDSVLKIPISLKPRLDDALLSCGEHLLEMGDKQQAAAIFDRLYKGGSSELSKAAALNGLVHSLSPGEAEAILFEALNKPDLQMQTTALRLACEFSKENVLAEIANKMPKFSLLLQVRFLAALTEFKVASGKDIALKSLNSSFSDVFLAALECLKVVGDHSCVLPLARIAAEAADRSQREAVLETLVRLPDEKADDIIVEQIQTYNLTNEKEAKTAAALISAAGRRSIHEALPAVLRAASAEDRAVRREAFVTLQAVAEPADLPQLVSFLNQPNSEVEKTLVIVALKEDRRKGRADAILSFLKKTQDDSVKAATYRVLGQTGDPDSLEVLREGLQSSNPDLRKAAFRGLTEWPGTEVMDDMKQFITQGEDETSKVLAFRAYVRMLRQSGMGTGDLVSALVQAMEMAPRESENKAVLAVLGEQASDQALIVTVKTLENAELKAEAQAAVLGICEKLIRRRPGMCKTALTKLLESNPSEEVENRAKELLEDLK